MRWTLACLFAFAAPALAQSPEGIGADPAGDPAVVEALQRAREAVAPSLVEIEALGGIPKQHKAPENKAQADQAGILVGKGFKQAFGPTTGVIVSADGLIATSTFVLNRKPEFLIATLYDGRSHVAKVVGIDRAHGLVLLKIDAANLPVPRFAAKDEIKVGRFAFALGRGLATEEPALALGIVSGLRRLSGRAIQSSALISPVNYGGPLVGIDGAVLGLLVPLNLRGQMASVDIYDSGIGFAIPADALPAIWKRLSAGEGKLVELKPGFAGFAPDPKHRGKGVRVAQVVPGSPAAKAGLKPGHLVLALDGQATESPWQVKHGLARRYLGEEVTLKVEWQGTPATLKLTLAEPPKGPGIPGLPGPIQPPGPNPPQPPR